MSDTKTYLLCRDLIVELEQKSCCDDHSIEAVATAFVTICDLNKRRIIDELESAFNNIASIKGSNEKLILNEYGRPYHADISTQLMN